MKKTIGFLAALLAVALCLAACGDKTVETVDNTVAVAVHLCIRPFAAAKGILNILPFFVAAKIMRCLMLNHW